MTVKDINDVLEIQNECSLSSWTRLDYKKEIENKDSIKKVAISDDGKIIGFAVVRLLLDSNDSEMLYGSSEIYNIALRKSFQNRGIGQKIFDKIISDLIEKDISEVWLEVRQSNIKAVNFYKKNGFLKHSVRKNYYKNPSEDALIMKLLLKNEKPY